MKPIAMPNSSTTAMDGQTFQSALVVSRPSRRPEEPIITPADRSNSPPIISSATGTATMPYCAAWSVQPAAIAGSLSQWTSLAKYPNASQTATAPRNAPMSGGERTRWRKPTRTSRSSGRAAGAAVAMVRSPDQRAGDRGRPPVAVSLARACLRELGDVRWFRLVDDSRPGQHRLAVPHGVEVRHPEHREHDRQVALEVLLLVDREHHPPGEDLLDRAADVERPHLRALRDAVEAGDRHVRVEAEEAVELLVRPERGLDLRLRARDVRLRVRDRERLHRGAAEDLLDAGGALCEAGVAGLVDDDQDLLRPGRLELLAGALAGDVLRLAHVDFVVRERVERAQARVHGDDLDPLRRGAAEWITERARVRDRGRDDLRARRDAGVDPGDLLGDVVVRVDLRGADAAAAEILRRLVDALLEDGPERPGIAVRDDGDLDRACARSGERGGGRLERAQPGGREPALDQEPATRDLRRFELQLFDVHVALLCGDGGCWCDLLPSGGLCASHLLGRDGTPLGARPVGRQGHDQRGAGLVERAGARSPALDRADERLELGPVRRLEALDEVPVAGRSVAARAGLD